MSNPNIYCDPERRHDFLFVFDVQDGNPNGDPDAGNMPRIDPETNHGLVSDVCLKRKLRNYVGLSKRDTPPYRIYVNDQGIALNTLHQEGYDAKEIKSTGTKQKRDEVATVREWMCGQFYDIRTFGAVMTTEKNAGQVRGPMQLTFARSVSPVTPVDATITRVAITKESDANVVEGEDGKTSGKTTEMGGKWLLPYGLYVAKGFYSPHLAKQTGFGKEDLELFWTGLMNMMDLDHSASRGMMSARGLYVFSHQNPLGNAPSHKLFSRLSIVANTETPRSIEDYQITLSPDGLPEGVEITSLLD